MSGKRTPASTPTADYLTLIECRTVARRFMAVMENHAAHKITGDEAAQCLKQLYADARRWAQEDN